MKTAVKNGTLKTIDDVEYIFYDDYWIRYYCPPKESLSEKKKLLDALTRRTFHHTEPGINTPGRNLEEARRAWEQETDLRRKRVNAAMLAGALFNRATDIFTAIVELEENGVDIHGDNELMRECADCFSKALELSPHVKHSSGEQGIDELWGEPVKIFTMSIKDYYSSRYRKIAQAMREIDQIRMKLHQVLSGQPFFTDATELIDEFVDIAKQECEIFRSDSAYYQIWPKFVTSSEKLNEYTAHIPMDADIDLSRHIKRGVRLLRSGKKLIMYIASIRVPMPLSADDFFEKCRKYHTDTEQIAKKQG